MIGAANQTILSSGLGLSASKLVLIFEAAFLLHALDSGVGKHVSIASSISTLVVRDRSDLPAPATLSTSQPFQSRPNPLPAAFRFYSSRNRSTASPEVAL
jgi:hypothetical protein